MVDRCRRVVGERETTVNPAGKVVTQPPEPLPAQSDSQKLSFVRNQVHLYTHKLGLSRGKQCSGSGGVQ